MFTLYFNKRLFTNKKLNNFIKYVKRKSTLTADNRIAAPIVSIYLLTGNSNSKKKKNRKFREHGFNNSAVFLEN